ncbi:RNA polymerase sigma factor RpoD/SigA [Nitrospinae bacterium AH-259-F20]|nr:RNA polymerase sigma factor RpoD/SigA [Nitrospinae bacterium AH-259-F20]
MAKTNGQTQTTSADPMTQYLRDIAALPMLTREEEIELARRIQRGDRDALRQLVEGNLRFVVSVAAKYATSQIPLIDLVNEGNMGLMRAAEKFDPDKGVRFITYAVWWITAAIKRALTKQTGVISVPVKHRDMVSVIRRTENELGQQLGRAPIGDEVAEVLGLDPHDVEARLRANSIPLSLDDAIADDPRLSYVNTLKGDVQIDEGLIAEELHDAIERLIRGLSKRERDIVKLRFGLSGKEPMTLEQVGKRMRLSKERIRQIERKALERLTPEAEAQELEVFLS